MQHLRSIVGKSIPEEALRNFRSRVDKRVDGNDGTFAQQPAWFTTAPAGAIRRAVDRAGWGLGEVGLYEINEAFAVVAMTTIKELALPPESVNVWGGAVALGHPIGCSGARILATLLSAMEQRGVSKGVAALCIGGGEAVAIAVER